VPEERAHDDSIAAIDGTGNRSNSLRASGGDAAAMRARRCHQRSARRPTGIEMKSNRQHSLENRGWRTNVRNAGPDRPRPETGDLRAPSHGDREILMPGDVPVGLGRLVEQDRPHRERGVRQACMHDRKQRRRLRQLANRRHSQHVPLPSAARCRGFLAGARHCTREHGALIVIKHTRHDHKPIALEVNGELGWQWIRHLRSSAIVSLSAMYDASAPSGRG
jgi:hypothetical protein